MAESAALLVDEVLPEQPVRQWVLSFPFQLRFLFASRPEIMGRVLGIVYVSLLRIWSEKQVTLTKRPEPARSL
jgi:hypothetical protein